MADFREPTDADLDLLAAVAVWKVHCDSDGRSWLTDGPNRTDVTDPADELYGFSRWIYLPGDGSDSPPDTCAYLLTRLGEQVLERHRPGLIEASRNAITD